MMPLELIGSADPRTAKKAGCPRGRAALPTASACAQSPREQAAENEADGGEREAWDDGTWHVINNPGHSDHEAEHA